MSEWETIGKASDGWETIAPPPKVASAPPQSMMQRAGSALNEATGAVAEPVVYMIGQYVVGGFYRVHNQRAKDENLNSPGMQFEPLAFATCCNQPNEHLGPHDAENRFYVYSVIARLSLLATCLEKSEIE